MSIGNKATKVLEDEQNALKGVYDQNTGEYIHREDPVPDTVTETSITRNSDGTWNKRENTREKPFHDERAVNQIESKIGDNATTLQQFCKTIDDQIIEYNNQINSKKEQIIEITEQTLTPGNCYPGVGYSNPAGMGAPNPPLYFGTRVIMNNDIETLKIYSSMAGPDENAGVMNPFEPDEEKNLVVNNSGYGYQNLRDPLVALGKTSYPGGITTDGSGSYIGTTFLPASLSLDDSQQANYSIPYGGAVWNAVIPALSSGITAADCVGASKSIVDLYQEIVGIRSERDKLRPDLNIIKDNKKDKEIQAWGLKNMKEKIKQRGNENQSAINAIKKFTADGIKSEEGLVLFLDAGNNSSYWGTGSIWYDLTEHGNHATIIPPPPDDLLPDWHMGNNNASYFNFDGEHSYVNFDAVGVGSLPSITPTVSVEMLAKVNMIESVGVSSVLFGWDEYAVVGFGTTAFGYTTNNGEVNGIGTVGISTWGINGNWRHYVFEMRSDVAYSNNKIYINGSLADEAEQLWGSEDSSNRVFNTGVGRIGSWRFNIDHLLDGSISVVKIYTKSFTGEEIQEKYDALKGRFGI